VNEKAIAAEPERKKIGILEENGRARYDIIMTQPENSSFGTDMLREET
jgi:hypothetical protein